MTPEAAPALCTDDKPILELLNIPGGKVWRKTYAETTKAFFKEGVSIVQVMVFCRRLNRYNR